MFWRVRFFSSHLRFSGVFSANLTGAEKKRTLQKHPFRRPFPYTTPSLLDFWGSFPMESDSSHPQSRVLKILIRFPLKNCPLRAWQDDCRRETSWLSLRRSLCFAASTAKQTLMQVFKRRGERDNTSRPPIRMIITIIKIEPFPPKEAGQGDPGRAYRNAFPILARLPLYQTGRIPENRGLV